MPPRVPPRSSSDDHPSRTTATGYRSVPYSVLADSHDRLKAAWWGTRSLSEGAPTLSALVERVFTTYSADAEARVNDGHSFPPAPARAQGARSVAAGSGRRARAYYLPASLHDRFKAAWWATRDQQTGKPALNELVESLFAAAAAHLEQMHNDGHRFPPAPARARGVSAEGAQRQGERQRQLWQARRDEGQD